MKLVIEIDPARLDGFDVRQVLATVSAKEYDNILKGGEPLDLHLVNYRCPPEEQRPDWCGTIRLIED